MHRKTKELTFLFSNETTVRLEAGALALMGDHDTEVRMIVRPISLVGRADASDLLSGSIDMPVKPAVAQIPGSKAFLSAAVDTRCSKLIVEAAPHSDQLVAASLALSLSERRAAESLSLDEWLPVTRMLDEQMPHPQRRGTERETY